MPEQSITKSQVRQLSSVAEDLRYMRRIDELEAENAYLHGEINRLHAEIRYRQGVRNQLASLYGQVDKRILEVIETRGTRPVKKKKTVRFAIDISRLKAMSKKELLDLSRGADAKAYFRYNAPTSDVRVLYRLINGAYVATRDTTKFGVKGAYRLSKRLKR